MNSYVREDMARSRRDLSEVVWPAIRDEVGGGDLVLTEGSPHETDRDMDILGGVDAYQRFRSAGIARMRGIASRVQWVASSYETFTVRYRRERTPLEATEYQKRNAAVEDGGVLPQLTVQAYVHDKTRDVIAIAIIQTKDLYEHLKQCGGADQNFPMKRSQRCYYEETRERGSARFVVVPWRHLVDLGIHVALVRGPIRAPWTWACLVCNTTGNGDLSLHRCSELLANCLTKIKTSDSAFVVSRWVWRLRYALPGIADEDLLKIVRAPIQRDHLVELLGQTWSPRIGSRKSYIDPNVSPQDLDRGGLR